MDGHELVDLEDMIDSKGLARVLEGIRDICHAKAEHLQSNWQDKNAGDAWTRIAKKLEDVILHARGL